MRLARRMTKCKNPALATATCSRAEAEHRLLRRLSTSVRLLVTSAEAEPVSRLPQWKTTLASRVCEPSGDQKESMACCISSLVCTLAQRAPPSTLLKCPLALDPRRCAAAEAQLLAAPTGYWVELGGGSSGRGGWAAADAEPAVDSDDDPWRGCWIPH